jgi:inhibitor of KinA
VVPSTSIEPELTYASDHSLLVSFGADAGRKVSEKVLRLTSLLLHDLRKEILNVHPAYTSVLITFDPNVTVAVELERRVHGLCERMGTVETPAPKAITIPVCYEGEFSPDLEHVARHNGLSPADVVRLHKSAAYTVCFLGFSPGFPYLAGLPEQIATPRRASPRLRVAAGSVGIAGRQTGIYPDSSPGGWQVIGRTPLRLFNPSLDPPSLLNMGDEVRFEPISPARYAELTAAIGIHQPTTRGV